MFLNCMDTDVIDNMNMIIVSIRRSTNVNVSIHISISSTMYTMPTRISLNISIGIHIQHIRHIETRTDNSWKDRKSVSIRI